MQKVSEFLKNISFKKNKNSLFIILLIGVMLLFSNKILFGESREKNVTSKENSDIDTSFDQTEKKLEDILKKIEGVGRVSVMVTYDNSKEYVTVSDTKSSESVKGEENKEKNTSNERTTVMVKESGSQTPFIKNEINPKIRGVLVVADGANSEKIKLNLKKAVCAVLNVEIHKVEIMPMKGK